MSSMMINLGVLVLLMAAVQGGNSADYPYNSGFMIHPAVIPQSVMRGYDAADQVVELGSPCEQNVTCGFLPNTYCKEKRCQCLLNFVEDPLFPGNCKLAPGYNEKCHEGEVKCRAPFICNSTASCDCPPGHLQEYFQCIRDCPSGHIPVDGQCFPARQLGEKCGKAEQCMQSFSQCLHGQCQCIPGANQLNGKCFPVNQCPLGEPKKDKRGGLVECREDEGTSCPSDYYCLYPQFANSQGFCCPKIKMNCPIGKPLAGHNCSSCPWESHHCFSYVIGSYTETMCCPNACPASQPIQAEGQCFTRAAFGGHCMVDEQCYNVVGAVCRAKTGSEEKQCLCPAGNYVNHFGKCDRESNLGEECSRNEECRVGTNTVCVKGVCSCFQGYMPQPVKGTQGNPQKCIAEPSCPTAKGVEAVKGAYEECSGEGNGGCGEGKFCRHWWYEGDTTFSLCCNKPRQEDYKAICEPFGMRLVNSDSGEGPKLCDISPAPQFLLHDAQGSVGLDGEKVRYCNTGASCVFDPFSVNMGVCCEPLRPKIQGKIRKDKSRNPDESQTKKSGKAGKNKVSEPKVEIEEKEPEQPKRERKVVQIRKRTGVPVISLRQGGRKSTLNIDN